MPSKPAGEAVPNRARTVLAGAHHALLTLPHERLRGWIAVLDDGGEPVLLASPGSPPALAVDSRLPARVDIPGPRGERLILAGSLRPVTGRAEDLIARLTTNGAAHPTVGAAGCEHRLETLAMTVSEVVLCLLADDPASPIHPAGTGVRDPGRGGRPCHAGPAIRHGRLWAGESSGVRIDLATYALAEPDLIAAHAPALIRHLNNVHGQQIRRLAEHAVTAHPDPAGGTVTATGPKVASIIPSAPGHDLAGVQITEIDRGGLNMWRVGTRGAEELRIPFQAPLAEPRALGRELRRLLSLV